LWNYLPSNNSCYLADKQQMAANHQKENLAVGHHLKANHLVVGADVLHTTTVAATTTIPVVVMAEDIKLPQQSLSLAIN
jgi:hypothetical protein